MLNIMQKWNKCVWVWLYEQGFVDIVLSWVNVSAIGMLGQ